MPIRFRKSFKLFPGVKVNLTKGGMSVTLGRRGATLNFSKRGVKQTIGIPGSGLTESSYIVKNEPESKKEYDKEDKEEDKAENSKAASEVEGTPRRWI